MIYIAVILRSTYHRKKGEDAAKWLFDIAKQRSELPLLKTNKRLLRITKNAPGKFILAEASFFVYSS